METFAFSKTMNNQSSRFSFLRSASSAAAAAALALALSALTAPSARAQGQNQSGGDRIPVTLSDPSRPAHVKVSLVNGGITVKAYDGKEVVVEAHVRNRENSRNEGGPKRLALSTTGLSVDDINGSVTLNNISGSAVAHALNGHVHATFTRVNPQKAMAFSSLNGDIDVTFPADLKANVSIRSDQGDVFSDFDVQLRATASSPVVEDNRGKGGKYRVKIDKTVHGTINGGGPEFQFTNFQGQIYIRKAGNPR